MMSIAQSFFSQWRKPTGPLGFLLARILNASHGAGVAWGLQQIQIEEDFSILDVGCGGGRTVHEMSKTDIGGKVFGIDYAEECVKVSTRVNAKLIEQGRVSIQQGTVSELPFPDATFDLVTAVNSHYYWPCLLTDMREVLRVLKVEGMFSIIGEAYKGGKFDKRNRRFVELVNLTYMSIAELKELLRQVGFIDTEVFEQYEKGWICATARKKL
jgi:ubiquinone/menaquinone biosynthesis C-methylase UbiE